MSAAPLVSVVVLNHNNARFVGEAIESVVVQTYRHWEMILVENGSTDDSWEVIRAWMKREPRIRAIRLPAPSTSPPEETWDWPSLKGAISLRWTATTSGSPNCSPAWSSSWNESKIRISESAGPIACLLMLWERRSGERNFHRPTASAGGAFWYRDPFCHCAVLMRKICFDRLGPYDESFAVAEDLELQMRFGQTFRLHNVPEDLARIRISGRNVTLRKHREVIRQTLRARRLGFTRYGYSIGWCGRIALALTWCMQWLPARLVHWLFKKVVLRQRPSGRNVLVEGSITPSASPLVLDHR